MLEMFFRKFISIKSILFVTLFVFIFPQLILNIWWIFDCNYCFGIGCRFSVCEGYEHKCVDQCYHQNLINDKEIHLKKTSFPKKSMKYRNYWQKISVTETEESVYVYSAFSTNDNINCVIILAKVYYSSHQLFNKYDNLFECQLIDSNLGVMTRSISAKFIKVQEHLGYETTRITCVFPIAIPNPSPRFARLIHKEVKGLASDPILIDYVSDNSGLQTPEIVVCVRPLFGGYSSVRSLLEFIAYYRTQGIDKIVFYRESVTEPVLKLLNSMSEFVETLPWVLKNGQSFTPEDQIASIDDCLHRFRSNVIIFIDVDEFIVPFGEESLKDLILSEYKNRKTIALSIRNVFFCCEYNTDYKKAFPRILSHFYRQSTVWLDWPTGWRSKLIVLRPHLIDRMGIHEVMRLSPNNSGSYVKHLDISEGLMFHYRSCCGVGRTPVLYGVMSFPTIRDRVIFDNRIEKFSQKVMSFINNYINFY